jgi:hypothetical protein
VCGGQYFGPRHLRVVGKEHLGGADLVEPSSSSGSEYGVPFLLKTSVWLVANRIKRLRPRTPSRSGRGKWHSRRGAAAARLR